MSGVGEGTGDGVGDGVGYDVGDDVGDNVGDGIGLRRIAPLGFRSILYIQGISVSLLNRLQHLLEC